MKRLKQLEFLVFKRGGVAGAIRRIIYRWRGLFTSSLITAELARKYPMLWPAEHQVQDNLEYLRSRNRIQIAGFNPWELLYKLAPYQLTFKFT